MKTMFLEQAEKTNIVKLIFNRVKISNNKIILNIDLKKAKLKSKIKTAKKVKAILDSKKTKQLCIAKKIKEDEQFIDLLYSNNIKICTPKWIFKQYTDHIICKLMESIKKEETELSFCVNEVDSQIEKYIYKYAKEFKRINIITNHIGKFKKIEEKIYNDEGILINITNNRKKSLSKAKLIINVDFPKELLNEFIIYDKSVIINWDEPLKIRKKRFEGKIIEEIKLYKNYEIEKLIKENILQEYDEREICQAFEIIPNIEFDIC